MAAIGGDRKARAAELVNEQLSIISKDSPKDLWLLFTACLKNTSKSAQSVYFRTLVKGKITSDKQENPLLTTEKDRKFIIDQLAKSTLELRSE